MMKRITGHAKNLLDETRLLKHDTSATQFRKALDVANLLKVQLEEMIKGKPSSTTPKHERRILVTD